MTSEFLIFWGYDSYIAAFRKLPCWACNVACFAWKEFRRDTFPLHLQQSSSDYSGVASPLLGHMFPSGYQLRRRIFFRLQRPI